MRSDFFQKYLSIILIFFLFVSQTIQVSFFDSTEAATDDYRDIVSIVVDVDTYDALSSEIKRYSNDIQSYLGATRVSLFVVPKTIEPHAIAAKNESLYYEGDGKKGASALVGTILIGNVPLPIVHVDTKSFPSLYPYVDFREKHFVYNTLTRQYEFSKTGTEGSDVEIWHGVINPAVGRAWNAKEDIKKIRQFLDKTHDFYQGKGKFVPSTNPPRVFYYDGYNESAALDFRALYQYVLSMKNMENFAYKRFSKYLLSDINSALAEYDSKNNKEQNETLASLGINGGSDTLDAESIAKMPDIQTVQPIRSLTKRFFEIINTKTLGDEQLYVHNAGRYTSGSTVRVDQGSVLTTLTDELAARTLKEANDALEASITDTIQTKYASNIIIFDRATVTSIGNPSPDPNDHTGSYTQEYKNYYFGTEAASIKQVDQCSIARGTVGDQAEFGKSILVEANVGYNVNATQAHAELLKKDTEELVNLHRNANYACFDTNSNVPKITSYWGKNSLLRLANARGEDGANFLYTDPAGTSFSGFNLPIFSLEGMKETKRLTPLSPTDCTTNRYQYTLLQPYRYTYYQGDYLSHSSCTGNWPNEWNNGGSFCNATAKTPRFTCVTNQVVDTNVPDLAKSLTEYATRSCFAGSISLDGKVIASINNTCINTYTAGSDAEGGTYSYTVDNTRYENRYYHSIPSTVTHVSPTPEEYQAAESNATTPSLPIDEVRSLEFFTPKGNLAKFTYPNFFQVVGSDIPNVRSWLSDLSRQQWSTIIAKENASPNSPIAAYLGGKSLPPSPIDWNDFVSDAVIQKVLQARAWLHPDVTEKYASMIESALSYSHIDVTKSGSTMPPIIPYQSEGYDIAYLGLSSFATDILGGADGAQKKDMESYQMSLGELEGINLSEEDAKTNPEPKQSAECGPPDGVPLFQWPSAILCWIKTLTPPKIMGGSCGGNTIGITGSSRMSVAPPVALSGALQSYYDAAKLVYSIPRSNIARNDSTEMVFDFITSENAHIELPPRSSVALDIVSIESGGKVIPSDQYASYFEVAPQSVPYTQQGARFVGLSKSRLATVQLRATLSIPYDDGGVYTTVSQMLTLRITDEFLDVHPNVGGSFTGIIDTNLAENVSLSVVPKNASGVTLTGALPYMLDIYDDVTNTLIASGITIPSNSYLIPLDYTKRIGVYKFIVRDTSGRTGTTTLAVRSGPFEKINFTPVSSALLYGASSFGFLRLTDRLGNLLSPEGHTIHIETQGGFLLESDGSRKTSLDLDTMESESTIAFGADTPGTMKITITVDGIKTQVSTIRVLERAKVQLERVGGIPLVGGDAVKVRLRILDAQNEVVRGFSSFAHLDIPEAAGTFDEDSIRIEDGTSSYFSFFPGRLAGDHALAITVPGIGTIPDIIFSTQPGIPMYVTHTIRDTTVDWMLVDRYGNMTSVNATGTILRDAGTVQPISLVSGMYTMPRNPGYYTIQVPMLANNTIAYSDMQGDHVFTGITNASVFIPKKQETWKFAPDYNARYSVLAGDSYLREGESILYDTDPGKSQSLAVSTVLTSPYVQDILFEAVPGGGFLLGKSMDISITPSARIEKGVLTLHAFESVTQKEIASLKYPISGTNLSVCSDSDNSAHGCEAIQDQPGIRLITTDTTGLYTGSLQDDTLMLYRDTKTLLSVTKNGIWKMADGIRLVPNETLSRRHLVLDILESDTMVGRIMIAMDITKSVALDTGDTTLLTPNTVYMNGNSSFSLRESYDTIFRVDRHGYQVYRPSNTSTLDETIIGPNSVDSLGALRERSGIGWRGNNRMMLSYSAGDTVGEATKWFQTYTLVNLGDPVTHVDAHALGTEQEGIDRSIGTQIASSSHGTVTSYAHRDMNHDGFEDIIVVYSDGFMELFLNLNGKFRSRGMMAYAPDLSNRGITIGDFVGDGYGDILGVNNSGSLILIENSERKLTRTDIQVLSGSNMSIPVPTGIAQYKIYDMDADGRDDIVYLTESGELGVLYGTQTLGVFEKKILDSTLGVKLSTDPETTGGAVLFDRIPKLPSLNAASSGTGIEDESTLRSEVYVQRSVYDANAAGAFSDSIVTPVDTAGAEQIMTTALKDPNTNTTSTTRTDTYLKSQYAPAFGLKIEKHYQNINAATLHAGDTIRVDIAFTNTSNSPISGFEYLDTIPKIFDTEKTHTYRMTLGDESQEKPFEWLATEEYDAHFIGRDIPAGSTLHMTYEVRALAASYGEMSVGKFEGGEVGDDIYGDVGFKTSTTCGAEMILWRSTAVREYVRGTRSFTQAELPDGVSQKLIDTDNNGIPDSVEKMSQAEQQSAYQDMQKTSKNGYLTDSKIVQANVSSDKRVLDIGLSPRATQDILTITENLANGLSCGFGGGSCMSFPMNWAPLAPGSDPVAFGNPIGDGFKVGEGLPLFSGLTRMDVGVSPYCVTFPVVWPISPFSLNSNKSCNSANVAAAWAEAASVMASGGKTSASSDLGAGGMLGVQSTSNFLRIFVTPTLTLGMGSAICMGGPAKTIGGNPGKGLTPLIQGGNCIVMTRPMNVCKNDGSSADGSVRGISGLGSMTAAWNGQSCSIQASTSSATKASDAKLTEDIIEYLKNPNTKRINALYSALANRSPRSVEGGPAISIGGGGAGTEAVIEIDAKNVFNPGKVLKIKNKRIPGFPDFIMDWVARQSDEITNKLFSLPNLVVIPPKNLGPNATIDGTYGDFLDKFSEQNRKQGLDTLKAQVGDTFTKADGTNGFLQKLGVSDAAVQQAQKGVTTGTGTFDGPMNTLTQMKSDYVNYVNKTAKENASTINKIAGGAGSMKAVSNFLGQIPFLRIEKTSIPVNVPWITPSELDRYARALKSYQAEIESKKSLWCNGNFDASCLDSKTNTQMSGLTSSIEQNLARIEEYKRFPQKLQKYITWKQRYMTQLICNVNMIEQVTVGWMRDNGLRFRKWAEFYVLLKTVVSTWQPMIDIFKNAEAQCSVCRNERYDAKYFLFKLISALIPSLPVLQFPRWPNIVLNLSDVRLAMSVKVPEFVFNIRPIRLPNLPELGLPGAPTANLELPKLDVIPPPPILPELPDLPSLPRIQFPNLPPPPKLPKLFGSVQAMLKIIDLFLKVRCYAQKTVLIPEWRAGDVIAQRTERQGTLPFDFLKLQFPQFAIPAIREIGVLSHVNFEMRSEFIAEYAKASVKPINNFATDLSHMLPSKVGTDVNISTPSSVKVKVESSTIDQSPLMRLLAGLQADAEIPLSTDAFYPYLRSQMVAANLDYAKLDRSMRGARMESEKIVNDFVKTHTESFRLMQSYLDAEMADTKEIEHLIDRLSEDHPRLLSDTISAAQFVSNSPSLSDIAGQKYEQYVAKQSRLTQKYSSENTLDTDIVRSFHGKMERLADATGIAGSSASSTLASGYAPNLQGIYILTPNGVQTRLFDYIEPLIGNETTEVIDIDRDGDMDYITLMDGALYVKYSHASAPVKTVDTTLTIADLEDTLVPSAPNFFEETEATPGQLHVSFVPASPEDTDFRLEFFDRYIEWDHADIGIHDESVRPRSIIDFATNQVPTTLGTVSVTPVTRVLGSVAGNPEGFILQGQKVSVIHPDNRFTLTAGRPIYTGKSTTMLVYDTKEATGMTLQLKPWTKYSFSNSIAGSLRTGKVYTFQSSEDEKMTYSDDLIGMPMLDGMTIQNTEGAISIYNTISKNSTYIEKDGIYQYHGLGSISDSYSINIPYANGFYYAKLTASRANGTLSDIAGVTLLAPQKSLDTDPPIIDLADTIRVPVYQKKEYLLKDIITDSSEYSVGIDPDTTIDENGDGIYDNDFVTQGTGVQIVNGKIIFGPYTTLDPHLMSIEIMDEFGNTTIHPLGIEVYTPTPRILSFGSGVFSGSLDEVISSEPIDAFRIRPGVAIKRISDPSLLTTDTGLFTSFAFSGTNGIRLQSSGSTTLLDEHTGIPALDSQLSLHIIPANGTSPMRLQYRDARDVVRFESFLQVPSSTPFSFNPTKDSDLSSMILRTYNSYTPISANLSDPGIPGGVYITDASKNPRAAIARDGNIYAFSDDLSLSAKKEGEYLMIRMMYQGQLIATCTYQIRFFSTILPE